MNLLELPQAVRRRWFIVALTTLLGLGVAGLIAFLSTPIYRSTVVLAPSAQGGGMELPSLGGLAAMAGLNLRSEAGPTDEALATLKSRAFLVSFIRERDLLPILFHDSWDSEHKKWRVPNEEAPNVGDGYRLFRKSVLTIAEEDDTGLISLSVEWRDAAVAARWAEDLVKVLNDQLRQRDIKEAERSLSYLERELKRTSMLEIQEAIHRLMESQIKTVMLANVRDDYAFRMVDRPVAFEHEVPVRPNRNVLLAIGFVFGISIGLLLVIAVANYESPRN